MFVTDKNVDPGCNASIGDPHGLKARVCKESMLYLSSKKFEISQSEFAGRAYTEGRRYLWVTPEQQREGQSQEEEEEE